MNGFGVVTGAFIETHSFSYNRTMFIWISIKPQTPQYLPYKTPTKKSSTRSATSLYQLAEVVRGLDMIFNGTFVPVIPLPQKPLKRTEET
jgi:hypothetical protein